MELEYHENHLPADLSAPPAVLRWRLRALAIAGVFAVLAVIDLLISHNFDYVLRGWLMGLMICLSFCLGGLALLMVQWVSGGKWGLLIRRPLEAMSRTLPLLFLMFLPIAIFAKRLYIWAKVIDPQAAFHAGVIDAMQAHAIEYKRPYLNLEGFWIRGIIYFLIFGIFVYFLNRWSLQRDFDTHHGNWFWQKRFENLSGPGLVIYSLVLTGMCVDWVMSLDPTWYSSMYGFMFIVSQGYAALALAVLMVLALSQYEPINAIFRVREQHDLGKLLFAFVMLNIYMAFSQYLIIWSGNLPNEIRWYMDRITGGWGPIAGLDFLFHWVLPFFLLLSRDLKRNKRRLAAVCCIMLFARFWDTWWLIAPNFPGDRRNLHFSMPELQYLFVPAAMVALWMAYYFTTLRTRGLVALNDPHLPEILEPEHAHA
ncbi:MAG TPA: hypothetical protein VIJ53_06445 [Acidobacteriaceae bacterium]